MSVFTSEHIDLLRQYFLSADTGSKKILLESFPPDLREKVILIQQEFEKGSDAKTIATEIGASDFEIEIEEIQSAYLLKMLGLDEKDFEKEIRSSITILERESLKKKLIAFEDDLSKELSDLELKSAITQIERESLKKKFQEIDDSLEGRVKPIYPTFEPAERPAAARPAADLLDNSFQIFLKYAVAACFIVAIGIGIYQFTKQDSVPENILADSSEDQPIDQKTNELPVIETLPLAEVSTTTDSYQVLKSGLGYGEVEEKMTVVVNNQRDRILSIEKAITTYTEQLNQLKEIQNPEAEQVVSDLKNRISSLQSELTQLTTQEKQYLFDGKVLKLFGSSVQTENKIVRIGSDYYLKSDARFFKLIVSKEPQNFLEETDSNVLKALEKIIFNAE